jgi:hypothetical protein
MRKAIIIIVLILFSFLFSALFLKAISGEDCWMPDGEGGPGLRRIIQARSGNPTVQCPLSGFSAARCSADYLYAYT